MKRYLIRLKRIDRAHLYRYFSFECEGVNFNIALLKAELKARNLKAQIGISYEVISIEQI